ncbi:hypothetical protein ACFC1R_07610 [Kitasatospora sp. NPDC056138]|uniref:hypothetical protein n=1 Tax=Kitasatospora sp. NPDC056138 TaxID=3345724 RepID=UPI0035DCD98F
MGILDKLRGMAHHQHEDPAQRAAIAHDEASDAFNDKAEKARDQARQAAELEEQDARRASDMTAEGDPWD